MVERNGQLLINTSKQKTIIELPSALKQAVRTRLRDMQAETGEKISINTLVNTLLACEFLSMDIQQVQGIVKLYRNATVSLDD